MAFAVTKFKAYGIRHSGAVHSHAKQVAEFTVTAAATDITYDLGTTAGTFWTSAEANGTYGGVASTAKYVLLTKIAGALTSLIDVKSEVLLQRLKVASGASGTQYTLAVSSSQPTLTFVSGSAPTSMVLVLEWLIADGQEPVVADLG